VRCGTGEYYEVNVFQPKLAKEVKKICAAQAIDLNSANFEKLI